MTTPPFPLWQAEAADATFSDPATCARRASTFERTIRVRNIFEYGAAAFVTVLFGAASIAAFSKGEWLFGSSTMVVLIGVAVVVRNLLKRGSNIDRRSEDPCLVHLKRQYERQHEFLRNVPLLYLGPLVPGIAMFYGVVAFRVAQVSSWAITLEGLAGPIAITVALFGFIALANWLAARSLARKIEEIDALA